MSRRRRCIPSDEARYAEMMVFIDWFNRVWKVAPNRIEAELAVRGSPTTC